MSTRGTIAIVAVVGFVALLGFGLLAEGETKISVGDKVPDRSLPVLEGEGQGAIADYRGKWVLVNLWASWCDPCRDEAPELERFAQQNPDVVVLGINVQDNSPDAIEFVRKHELTYPQLRSVGDERSDAFGSTGVPENFLVDPRGNVAAFWRGPIDDRFIEENFKPLIEAG